jgi:O-antigen/teichoic acid export membrane protein
MIENILANFSARFAGAIINFLILLLTTNYLGLDARGEISLIQLALNILHLLSDVAGGPGMVYLVPRTRLRPLLWIGYGWALGINALFGWLVVIFGDIDPAYQWRVVAIAVLLSLHSVNQNILVGREKIKHYNGLLLTQSLLLIGIMSICIFSHYQYSSVAFVTAGLIGAATVLLFSTIFVFRLPDLPALKIIEKPFLLLFRNGFYTQLASLTHQLSIRINFYLLGSLAVLPVLQKANLTSKAAIGLYSTAISLAEAILLFSASIATVLGARVANQNDPDKARHLVLQFAKLSFCITLPAIVLFLILPDGFYSGLLGKDFGPVKSIFLFIAPGALCVSLTTVFSHYFSGRGKHYLNAWSGSLALITTLITAWLFIPNMGLIGAGLSATCAYLVMMLFVFTAFLREHGKPTGEWRTLIPTRNDFYEVKEHVVKLFQKLR